MNGREGKWLEAAGLVLVRQRPGSAKGVMFIAEDETCLLRDLRRRRRATARFIDEIYNAKRPHVAQPRPAKFCVASTLMHVHNNRFQ